MVDQYSDSRLPATVLAVDTASARISVALGREGRALATREAASGRASPSLMLMIDEVLGEAGLSVRQIDACLSVRGPGSFTGLRVGLATLLGLHRSLGVPATAVAAFEFLAWQARLDAPIGVAVVDALREEWFSCRFELGDRPRRLEEPRLRGHRELLDLDPELLIGFGVGLLTDAGVPESRLAPAQPLAPAMLEYAAAVPIEWDPAALTDPFYLRPAATTPPKARRKPKLPDRERLGSS